MAKQVEVDALEAHAAFCRLLKAEKADATAVLADGVVIVAATGELAEEILAWWASKVAHGNVDAELVFGCDCAVCGQRRQLQGMLPDRGVA